MKRIVLLVLMMSSIQLSRATHLVYLDGYAECMGLTPNGTQYQLTIIAVRDIGASTVPFDLNIDLGVYRKSDGVLQTILSMELTRQRTIYKQATTTAWLEEGIFSGLIELPDLPDGYAVQYIRCCVASYANIPKDIGTEVLFHLPSGMKPGQYTLKPVLDLRPYLRVNQTYHFSYPWEHNLYDSVRFETMDYFLGGNLGDAAPDPPSKLKPGAKGSFVNGAAPGNPFGLHGTWTRNSDTSYQIHLTSAQRFIYPITSTCYLNGDSIKQTVVFPAIGVNADFPLLWLELVERHWNRIELLATSSDWTQVDSILLQRREEGMSQGSFETIDPAISPGASVPLVDADGAIATMSDFEYRIKLVSNGKAYYSNIVKAEADSNTVSVKQSRSRLLSLVYPNPSAGLIYIQTPLAGPYTLRNTSGQMLGTGMLKEGLNPLDFQSLPNGIYFLSTESETVRIVLMH